MGLADDMRWMLEYEHKHDDPVWRRADHREPDNFRYLLIHLFLKADAGNYARLKFVYPQVARAIEHWRATGEILVDAAYDDKDRTFWR